MQLSPSPRVPPSSCAFPAAYKSLACAASFLQPANALPQSPALSRLNQPARPSTMLSKIFVTALALVGAVSAAPTGGSGSTGGAQCCQNVQNSSQLDAITKGILGGLLGVVVSGLNVPIGTGCTPISVLGGVSCNTNTVNCGQYFGG
jgi:hypothetical protein